MSRIGKRPVPVPANVQATVAGQKVTLKGPKGELALDMPEELKVEKTAAGIALTPREDSKTARSMWGMSRTLIANNIVGVQNGYSRTLEIHGVGYRAQMKGKDLNLQVGFASDITYKIPAGVEVKIAGAKQEQIQITGIDKQKVGQVAAEIRAFKKPEPYQLKGIRYQGEYILKKEGKKK
ncbi:MAG TPA: 50S ribosomal protein L6 [Hyphomicrobiaceae bacterium]|nr:50S ribosomal protein L6 [Hyphomicrobiaceae bacterium]